MKIYQEKRLLAIMLVVVLMGALLALTGCASGSGTAAGTSSAPESSAEGTASAEASAESTDAATAGGPVLADIDIADYGTITVELDPASAPVTVENFVKLAKSGFYDGLTFHRIMEGFMMQGGAPNGNSTGGSEENIVGEFSQNGYDNPISHVRGTISMARSSDPDSASSQFFIVQGDSLFLDGAYAGFGHVVEGMDVVDAICADAAPIDNNGTISADAQPVITSVTIRS